MDERYGLRAMRYAVLIWSGNSFMDDPRISKSRTKI